MWVSSSRTRCFQRAAIIPQANLGPVKNRIFLWKSVGIWHVLVCETVSRQDLNSICSVFLKCVSFRKTLVFEKWLAEFYVKVYADFHESKVVLVMSHAQKYFVFHVKRHHIDANPWEVRWVTSYATIILKGKSALWRRWVFHVDNMEFLMPTTLRLHWFNSLVTKRQHDHMDMMEEWPVDDYWPLGRNTTTWSDVILLDWACKIQRDVVWSEAEKLWSRLSALRAVTSLLHDRVALHFIVKIVQGKTDYCHRLQGLCFFLSFHVPRLSWWILFRCTFRLFVCRGDAARVYLNCPESCLLPLALRCVKLSTIWTGRRQQTVAWKLVNGFVKALGRAASLLQWPWVERNADMVDITCRERYKSMKYEPLARGSCSD